MSSDVIDPPTGEPLPVPREPERPRPEEPTPHAAETQPVTNGSTTSTSSDELTARLTEARPDPLLGAFRSPAEEGVPVSGEASVAHRAHSSHAPAPESPAAVSSDSARADALNTLNKLHVDPSETSVVSPREDLPGSAEAFAALDLTAPPATTASPESAVAKAPDVAEDEDEDGGPERGISLGTLLLASYASAVTIGLIWVLWSGRQLKEEAPPDFLPPADTRPDPGLRADDARKVVPPEPLADDHITTLGKPIRVGQLEITPLKVTSGAVRLVRTFNPKEQKQGGANALKLRLRLRNVSSDAILAPFDEAFVRDRIGGGPDTFIETGEGGQTIPMFPLAVESEWSIVGQSFRELKPGDVFETLVVTAPGAAERMTPTMTWRVRLRTDINHTDDLGFRFEPGDVEREVATPLKVAPRAAANRPEAGARENAGLPENLRPR